MTTTLVLLLLLMTNTGCVLLPARVLQALLPAPRPEPDSTAYPKTILRGIVPGQKIDWIGNDTVVFAGYPVHTQSRSWLYSWDLKTAPKQILAGPKSFCVNGKIIKTSTRNIKTKQITKFYISPLENKSKTIIKSPSFKGINYVSDFTCEIRPTPGALIGHFWKELRPGQGYLDLGPLDESTRGYSVTRIHDNPVSRHETGIKIDLPTLIAIADWHPQPGYLLYDISLSLEERRRWQRTNQLTIWHLDEQQRGHAVKVAAGPWVNPHGGDILFLKARNGLVITTAGFQPDGSAGGAGAYLVQPDGRYERLETGFVSEPALSADGCRLAYALQQHFDQRSLPREGGRILVVVNLCASQTGR